MVNNMGATALTAGRTHVAHVQGAFSFTQDTLSTSEQIEATFKRAAKTICGAVHLDQKAAAPQVLSISSGSRGDVQASVSDLKQQEGVAGLTMACSCASNAPGGNLIVNADVSGASVKDIARVAGAL